MVEPSLVDASVGETVQFERLGYFTPDVDSRPDALVFNRTLTLKDTWAKVQAKG
jgi:glutaminyl-tRNA synthetase